LPTPSGIYSGSVLLVNGVINPASEEDRAQRETLGLGLGGPGSMGYLFSIMKRICRRGREKAS
jgi:hypothetical protein